MILSGKYTNAIGSIAAYSASLVIKRACGDFMPLAAGFELTNHCNLRCPECLCGSGLMTRASGFMDIRLFRKVLGELKPWLFNINLYFQGEPMMHPGFFEFIDASEGVNTVVSTNGHFLTGDNPRKIALSGLRKLIVSLDGLDKEAYLAYRKNGDLDKVITGLECLSHELKKIRSGPKIEIQMLVNRFNEHQVEEAGILARKLGATLKLKSMQVLNEEKTGEWMPASGRFRRYRKEGERYLVKSTLPNRCFRQWSSPVITWDGNVVPCCFDKNADHIMGNCVTTGFSDIWLGEKYRDFRNRILKGRREIEICKNCTSGLYFIRH